MPAAHAQSAHAQGGGGGGWELSTMERRYSVPPAPAHHRSSTALAPHAHGHGHPHPAMDHPQGPGPGNPQGHPLPRGPPHQQHQQHQQPPHQHQRTHSSVAAPSNSEDLHAWSIYRQNLNSDFTDSALGSSEKSPLPYGNFQLRDSTVHSILSHPRYGPKSALGANMYTYLKFGLPRVFPPSRGPRDGSSGYDSSDDNGSPHPRAHPLRSRSDPDFRSHLVTTQPPPPVAAHAPGPHHRPYSGPGARHGGGRSDAWRAKSNSEANLLNPETIYRHEHRRSVHDLRGAAAAAAASYVADMEGVGGPPLPLHAAHGGRHIGAGAGAGAGAARRPMSKAGSHASLALSRRSQTHLGPMDDVAASKVAAMSDIGGHAHPAMLAGGGGYYPGMAEHGLDASPFAYPHLQVRGLEVESRTNKRQLVLQGISMEVRGGEIMAIMATSAEEGTVLLDTLAGCSSSSPHAGRVTGDILLNGQCLRRSTLRNRVAYVRSERALNPDLSVEQTLYFTHWLRQPGYQGGKTDTKDRIAALVEDLGLEQVRHTKVWSLTTSERRRLAVASQLLLDTDILVLDRPTAGMDIFDTFFLVEFLRQWAGNGGTPVTPGMTGRIVILTLHPPTYEIFTMLSRVALMSTGRLMFCGRRRDMLPYFANAEYPCPAYKNPSDYYLDLVTLDDLSAEAMLESSQRIEQLADVFRRREEPLSDPGPPAGLPPSVRSANVVKQAVALLVCWSLYSQPAALSRWLSHLVLAVVLSLCVGVVWWDVAATDPQLLLGDRVGFLYATLVVMPWPLLLLQAAGGIGTGGGGGGGGGDNWWKAVAGDIRDRLYGRFIYIFCQIVYGFIPSLLIWLAYIVPSYTMTGLQNQATDPNALYVYTGFVALYLLALQSLLTALGVLLRSRRAAALLCGVLLLPLVLLSGGLLHERDISVRPWFDSYASMASPMRWVMPTLVRREYAPDVVAASVANIMCRNKQVQHQDIIVQLPCPPPNVTAALQYHGLYTDSSAQLLLGAKTWPVMYPAIALAAFWGLFVLLACIIFPVTVLRPKKQPASHCTPNRP